MPHFRKGYDEHLDLTEDEWLEQQMYDSEGEYEQMFGQAVAAVDALLNPIEGEPNEDTYFLGIPDYDCFNRPSWEVEE